jgi:hypothetical protein
MKAASGRKSLNSLILTNGQYVEKGASFECKAFWKGAYLAGQQPGSSLYLSDIHLSGCHLEEAPVTGPER